MDELVAATPFRDTAKKIAQSSDYVDMFVGSDKARSTSWWKHLVEYGAWKGPNNTRIGPPGPETLSGIAKLFKTTPDQVAAMIAADWYAVQHDTEISARMLRMAPNIDLLKESDAELIETLVERLACDGNNR